MKRTTVFLLVFLFAFNVLSARAEPAKPAVTRATYEEIPTEVSGQRVFVTPSFEMDVYEARFTDESSRIAFDLYPGEGENKPKSFSLKIDGADAAGWNFQAEAIEGMDGFGYVAVGPGFEALPSTVTLVPDGEQALQVTFFVRQRPFTHIESAYYLKSEVQVAEEVFPAMRAADNLKGVAARYIPKGARLIDCAVTERYASIDYRLDGTRVIVDYYEDGHVEKMLRDDDERIFTASTLSGHVDQTYMNDRMNLNGREELRPERVGTGAMIRSGGMCFAIEGYHYVGGKLTVDWSASSKREGLMAMLGYASAPGVEIDMQDSQANGGVEPMRALMPLTRQPRSLKGAQEMTVEGEIPASFDVTLALYVVDPIAPIVLLEDMTDRRDVPTIIDDSDGTLGCASFFERDEDGASGYSEDMVAKWVSDDYDEDAVIEDFYQNGYFKLMRKLELTFTVEP